MMKSDKIIDESSKRVVLFVFFGRTGPCIRLQQKETKIQYIKKIEPKQENYSLVVHEIASYTGQNSENPRGSTEYPSTGGNHDNGGVISFSRATDGN